MISTTEVKVRGYHIDQFGHVNNARYLEFLEEGRWFYAEENDHFEMFHTRGIGHVTVNIAINYRKSAFVGNMLRIETSVLKKGNKSLTMQQHVYLNDTQELLADAEVTNVYFYEKSGETVPVEEVFISK